MSDVQAADGGAAVNQQAMADEWAAAMEEQATKEKGASNARAMPLQ